MRRTASRWQGSRRWSDLARRRQDATKLALRGQARSRAHATAKPRGCRARTGGNRCAARTAGNPTANRSTIPTSELRDMSDHAGAHRLVRQQPGGGGHVFPHMINAGGRRDGAGHRRMRDDEFENDLRPAPATDLCGPPGQRTVLDLSEQLALAKWPVNDHADAAVPCQRQDTIFDLAVENVVGDLNEVERLGTHDPLDFTVPAAFRGRDPYISEPARSLHGEQRPQMLFPGEEIVDLQQIEASYAPESAGGFDLVRATGAGGDPDLVGRKQARWPIELGETVTNHLLGRAIHG